MAVDVEVLRIPQTLSHGAHALAYAQQGIPVFPLGVRGKLPLISKQKGGKGLYDATLDEEQVRAWWRAQPGANIGIRMGRSDEHGPASGWILLDADVQHGGNPQDIIDRFGPLPPTLMARSGGGGWHWLFERPGVDVEVRSFPLDEKTKIGVAGLLGVEVKADGGYVVAAPSVHPSGTRYEWEQLNAPAPLPKWLYEALITNRDVQRGRLYAMPSREMPGVSDGQGAGEGLQDGRYWLSKALGRTGDGASDRTGYWLAQQLLVNQVADPERWMQSYAHAATYDLNDPFDGRDIERWLRSAGESKIVRYGAPAQPRATTNGRAAHVATVLPAQRLTDDEEHMSPEPPVDADEGDEDPLDDGSGDYTDLGNARRFVTRHGKDVRFVFRMGRWLLWDGTRFEEDDTGGAERLAQDTSRAIANEAAGITDEEAFEHAVKWAKASRSEARIKAMLNVARTQPEVAVRAAQLDTDHMLLNTLSGVVDLRTGALLPHNRAHLMTKRAGAAYDPQAICPRWTQFLDTIFGGDTELIAYIQRAIGYSLTGDTREQCLFVCHGRGRNGKSTLFSVVSKLLGDYSRTARTETFVTKQNPGISNDVARLDGARFVTASEANEGDSLDEALVKSITGGDPMTARFMFQEYFEFTPVLKLWLATNNEPVIRGTDNGIWRRIRLIPFKVTIADPDEDLPRKLQAEAAGILAWAVRGCLEWQRIGLAPPTAVVDATTDYRERQDRLGQFLSEMCVLNPAYRVANKALRVAYTNWCDEYSERPLSQQKFGKQLRDRGIGSSRSDDNGSTTWYGMGLKATLDINASGDG